MGKESVRRKISVGFLIFGLFLGLVWPQRVWASVNMDKNLEQTEYSYLNEALETASETESRHVTETADEEMAESQTDEEIKTPDGAEKNTEIENTGRLKIEDTGVYKGMTKAYKDGYEPVALDEKVTIVLPIIANSDKMSELTVTPNLGDTSSSPFVYKNYQKTFKETEETVNGSQQKRKVFLISYTFELSDERSNGTYPVVFDITGDGEGAELQQSFTVYVRIMDAVSTDGDDNEPDDIIVDNGGGGGDSEETPESQPKLILSKCTSNPTHIEAGSEFELTAEIKNTNRNFYVQNMTIEVSWTEQGLTLEEDSKTFFIEKLGAGQSMQLPLKFKSGSNVAEGRYDITLNMSYDNPEAVSLSSVGTISVDIHQAMRVELEADTFPESVNAGDTFSLAVQAMNLGRGKICNVRCSVDVPGLSAGTSTFLGNIEAGNAVSGQLKIFAGMKDEAVYGSTYGETSGQLILTFEDEEGNTFTKELPVDTKVNPLVVQSDTGSADEKESSGLALQWLIGVVVLAVLASGVIIIRRKNRM